MNKTAITMVMVLVMVTAQAQALIPTAVNPVLVPVVDPVVILPVAKPVPVTKAPVNPNFWVGVCGVYTFGMDIETPSLGVGAEAGWMFSKEWRLGLSLTKWSDEVDVIQMDVLSFGASLYWAPKVLRGVYVGAGASINQIDMEVSLPGISIDVVDATGVHGLIGYEKNIYRNCCSLFVEVQIHNMNTTATVSSDCGESEVVEGTLDHIRTHAGIKLSF